MARCVAGLWYLEVAGVRQSCVGSLGLSQRAVAGNLGEKRQWREWPEQRAPPPGRSSWPSVNYRGPPESCPGASANKIFHHLECSELCLVFPSEERNHFSGSFVKVNIFIVL